MRGGAVKLQIMAVGFTRICISRDRPVTALCASVNDHQRNGANAYRLAKENLNGISSLPIFYDLSAPASYPAPR